jgi:biotin-(acetyl-CoA carboxylase) ligase
VNGKMEEQKMGKGKYGRKYKIKKKLVACMFMVWVTGVQFPSRLFSSTVFNHGF